MLDGVHAGAQGGVDAFPSRRVRGHATAESLCLVDDGLELFLGPVRPAAEASILADVRIAVGVELDPVGAVLYLLAHGASQVVGAVDELRAGWNLDLPGIAGQR